MTQAIAARDSLGLQTPLSFAIACMASRNFPFVNRTDTMQMATAAMAISRAHKNVEIFWDQHTNGDQVRMLQLFRIFNENSIYSIGFVMFVTS